MHFAAVLLDLISVGIDMHDIKRVKTNFKHCTCNAKTLLKAQLIRDSAVDSASHTVALELVRRRS